MTRAARTSTRALDRDGALFDHRAPVVAVPAPVVSGDSTDLAAECRRVGPRRGLVEVVVTSRVLHLCPKCVLPIVATNGNALMARDAVLRDHASHVPTGEGDLPMSCLRHGPRRALVEMSVGDVVIGCCLVCHVTERSRGYDLARVRADAVRRHASCFAKLGQWRANP